MIIKGKSRAGAGKLGNYLSSEGENERVELVEDEGNGRAGCPRRACRDGRLRHRHTVREATLPRA